MRMRVCRLIGGIIFGCTLQFGGCDSTQLNEIVARNIKTTVLDVGTFVLESTLDDALGL